MSDLERPLDAGRHIHVRPERVALEHEPGITATGREDEAPCAARDDASAEADLAPGRRLQAGEHTEDRRLAAAGRTEQDEERAPRDGEVDPGHRLDRAEALDEPGELDGGDCDIGGGNLVSVHRGLGRQGSPRSRRRPHRRENRRIELLPRPFALSGSQDPGYGCDLCCMCGRGPALPRC